MILRHRPTVAAAVGMLDAVLFVELTYYGQRLADSVNPVVPIWLRPAWLVLSFPARFLHLVPPLNHPFGFGNHEDLTLYLIAALNGAVWAAAFWILAASWARRRQSRTTDAETESPPPEVAAADKR